MAITKAVDSWALLLTKSVIACLFYVHLSAYGSVYTFYDSRPDILNLPQATSEENRPLSEAWIRFHFVLAAHIFELYPDYHIYFLARDMEYFYDAAKLIADGNKDASRIHLINVSRQNYVDPLLKDYLEQVGISNKELRTGKKILLLDTGYQGSIPKKIVSILDPSVRELVKTHLILSENHEIPSLRSVLRFFNSKAITHRPSELHGDIIIYEDLPRFSHSSDSFILRNGGITPYTKLNETGDGEINPSEALMIMRQLHGFWSENKNKKWLFQLKSKIQEIHRLWSKSDKYEALRVKHNISKVIGDPTLVDAILMDFLEFEVLNNRKTALQLNDLGITERAFSEYMLLKKYIMTQGHDKKLSENPKRLFSEWIEQRQLKLLSHIIDGGFEERIYRALVQALFEAPLSYSNLSLINQIILKRHYMVNNFIAKELLPKYNSSEYDGVIRSLIYARDQIALQYVVEYRLNNPSLHLDELLLETIIKMNDVVLLELIANEILFSERGIKLISSWTVFVQHAPIELLISARRHVITEGIPLHLNAWSIVRRYLIENEELNKYFRESFLDDIKVSSQCRRVFAN